MFGAAGVKVVLEFTVKFPPTTRLVVLPVAPTVTLWLVSLKVMLLKVCAAAVPLIFWLAPVLLKITLPVFGVNVPPLLVQSPALTVNVLVLPNRVPAVSVTVLLVACDKPAPRSSVPPLPFMVRPLQLILPPSVAVLPVLVIDTRPVVVNPAMLCVAVPAIVIGELPAVNVPPLLTKSPPNVTALLAVAKVTPLLIVNVPLATVAELKVFVPVPAKVTTLNVVALTESVWAAPPKLTVPVPAVNSEPVPPQAVALVLFSFNVLDPPLSVPAESVTSPVNVWVKPEPRLSVPPTPLIVNPAPPTLPPKVAVPPVFVIDTRPVVVNPAIACAALPLMVMGDALAVNVPLLVKFP